jgi:hypothetical protein
VHDGASAFKQKAFINQISSEVKQVDAYSQNKLSNSPASPLFYVGDVWLSTKEDCQLYQDLTEVRRDVQVIFYVAIKTQSKKNGDKCKNVQRRSP